MHAKIVVIVVLAIIIVFAIAGTFGYQLGKYEQQPERNMRVAFALARLPGDPTTANELLKSADASLILNQTAAYVAWATNGEYQIDPAKSKSFGWRTVLVNGRPKTENDLNIASNAEAKVFLQKALASFKINPAQYDLVSVGLHLSPRYPSRGIIYYRPQNHIWLNLDLTPDEKAEIIEVFSHEIFHYIGLNHLGEIICNENPVYLNRCFTHDYTDYSIMSSRGFKPIGNWELSPINAEIIRISTGKEITAGTFTLNKGKSANFLKVPLSHNKYSYLYIIPQRGKMTRNGELTHHRHGVEIWVKTKQPTGEKEVVGFLLVQRDPHMNRKSIPLIIKAHEQIIIENTEIQVCRESKTTITVAVNKTC